MVVERMRLVGAGPTLAALGLAADVLAGMALLSHRYAGGVALHALAVGMCVVGIQVTARHRRSAEAAQDDAAASPNGFGPLSSAFGLLPAASRLGVGGLLTICLIPGLGLVGCGLGFALSHLLGWRRQRTAPPNLSIDLEDPEPSARQVERQNPLASLEVQPLADIFAASDVQLKRAAIELLCEQPDAEWAATLRPLLADRDADVRTWAAIALSKIDSRYRQLLEEAQSRAASARESVDSLASLGSLFSDLAQFHASDETGRRRHLSQAVAAVQRGLALNPERLDLWIAQVRYQKDMGAGDAAWRVLDQVLGSHPNDAEVHLLAMEMAFEEARFDKVVRLAQRLSEADGCPETPALVTWWAQAAARPFSA